MAHKLRTRNPSQPPVMTTTNHIKSPFTRNRTHSKRPDTTAAKAEPPQSWKRRNYVEKNWSKGANHISSS
nr:unnamed protein product [Callosobruchus chinensis]